MAFVQRPREGSVVRRLPQPPRGHRGPHADLTPEHDTLIGEDAASILRRGIRDSVEHVIARTGHMFRFTHPVTYSRHIADFLQSWVPTTTVTMERDPSQTTAP